MWERRIGKKQMPRNGIEPLTRGFSVLSASKLHAFISIRICYRTFIINNLHDFDIHTLSHIKPIMFRLRGIKKA